MGDKPLTSKQRIDALESSVSDMSSKLDSILNAISCKGASPVKHIAEPIENVPSKARPVFVNGVRELTTEEALEPIPAQPRVFGKVPMNDKGEILGDWRKVVDPDTKETLLQEYRNGQPTNNFESFHTVEQNRFNFEKWQSKKAAKLKQLMSM